jgi:DNA replication ATP-dependent helicase Dna2
MDSINTPWERYLELCCGAIKKDEENQNKKIEEQWRKPLSERVEEGKAIRNVILYDIINENDKRFTLIFATNEKTGQFRTGDKILITDQEKLKHPDSWSSTIGTITKIEREPDGSIIEVEVLEGDIKCELKEEKVYFIDESKKDLSKKICEVLNECRNLENIYEILFKKRTESDNFSTAPLKNFESFCKDLNDSQMEAIKKSSQLKEYGFYYIQGPPGTGKTTTLARLSALLSRYGSVGMIAFTHRAINNFTNSVCNFIDREKLKDIKIHRIANDYQIDELVEKWKNKDFISFENNFTEIKRGNIYAATIHKFSYSYEEFQDENTKFDWLIFDEAGQISIPFIIASMYFGKRFIFCGDHKQLSPVVSLEEKDADEAIIKILKTSILERLIENYGENSHFQTTLDVTYRLNHTLAEFPNKTFYYGKLKVKTEQSNDLGLNLPLNDTIISKSIGDESSIVFLDVPNIPEVSFSSGLNETDAKIVARICKYLIDYYKNKKCTDEEIISEKIGVVSPYRNQCQEINNLVGYDVADTVERFQGQERDVIIISYARISPPNDDRIDFIYNPNRLNVAITRAKIKLIFVGNRKLFLNGTPLFREYFNYLKQKNAIKALTENEVQQLNEIFKKDLSETKQEKVKDRYRLIQEIHRGRMCTIYLAEDMKNNDKKIAIKKLNENREEEFIHRFKLEHEILLKLKGIQGIVQLYDDELKDDDNYYIAMEYVNGNSLDYIIYQQDGVELNKALNIMLKLCDVLSEIHKRDIAHLDLKPSNIIVNTSEEIKLIDFGKAEFLPIKEETKSTITSPEYLAPEQHSNCYQKCDKRTDIYALGIIFYEMLTGELPFKASDTLSWLDTKTKMGYQPIKFDNGKIAEKVLEKVNSIINKCLQNEPEQRYQSVDELKQDLKKLKDLIKYSE